MLYPVESNEWATTIVPVMKKNGRIRICRDFKVTLDPQMHVDKYPIPRIQDILAKNKYGAVQSKLDLSQAYPQVKLDPASQLLMKISTHKGLFRYKRLTYRIASAPGWFQREMESNLGDNEEVDVYKLLSIRPRSFRIDLWC